MCVQVQRAEGFPGDAPKELRHGPQQPHPQRPQQHLALAAFRCVFFCETFIILMQSIICFVF